MVSFLVKTLFLSLAIMTIFLSVSPFASIFVTMSSSNPVSVGKVNSWTRNSAERHESYHYESLAPSRHNTDLVYVEATVKPERPTEAP